MEPMVNIASYIDNMTCSVCYKISSVIDENAIGNIAKTDLCKFHLENKRSKKFQKYYFSTLNNEEYLLSSNGFFKEFSKQYALRIEASCCREFEKREKQMLKEIREGTLASLYCSTFRILVVKDGHNPKEVYFGSFFSKFVHTFSPNEYCALDNPIKNYFGLERESFFIAFLIVSAAYNRWAANNKELIGEIRKTLKKLDKDNVIDYARLTDMKLLDLIFWSKAKNENIATRHGRLA